MNSQEQLENQKRRLLELYRMKKAQKELAIAKHKQSIIQKAKQATNMADTDLMIEKILGRVTLGQLIDKLGVENVENELRTRKINRIKSKL